MSTLFQAAAVQAFSSPRDALKSYTPDSRVLMAAPRWRVAALVVAWGVTAPKVRAQTAVVIAEEKISDTEGGLQATLDNYDFFGASVAALGDLDGDPTTVEIAVGASGDDDGGNSRGAAYVLSVTPVSLAALNDQVAFLTDGGALNRGQSAALMRKLDNVQRKLDQGLTDDALAMLSGFIVQVEDYIADGTLTPKEAARLTRLAEALIAQIESTLESEQTAGKWAAQAASQGEGVPEDYVLAGNYPNPFNPQTTIRFGLPEAAQVRLGVYDLMGRRVAELVSSPLSAGWHEVAWQATGQASGTYLYRLEAGAHVEVGRMVLLK